MGRIGLVADSDNFQNDLRQDFSVGKNAQIPEGMSQVSKAEASKAIPLNAQKTYFLKNAEETLAFGSWVARHIEEKSVLALTGNLGAGKTTFVQGLALGLGISEQIQSPTFVLLNLYRGLAHFDLYRLKNQSDFKNLGFDEYFDAKVICAIEWPERIQGLLPAQTIHIHFEYDQGGRIAKVL